MIHERLDMQRGLELRQVDPARRRARRYHMAESSSLFGELGLVITWGRIGRPARIRFESFPSAAALESRWQELLARRKAHGYQIQSGASAQQVPLLLPSAVAAAS